MSWKTCQGWLWLTVVCWAGEGKGGLIGRGCRCRDAARVAAANGRAGNREDTIICGKVSAKQVSRAV